MAISFPIEELVRPLARLLLVMAAGLLAATFLEALHWTRFIARLASPLAKAGRLKETACASFALAFFSPAASNALLAESLNKGELSRRELFFANLFNSTPAYLVHLPTLFSTVFAFLGARAFIYVGLTFCAALGRTALTLIAGRLLLPPLAKEAAPALPTEQADSTGVLRKTWKRFKARIRKLILFTVPVYCIVFAAQHAGFFDAAEAFLGGHVSLFSFLKPEAISIVVLHLSAESGAALSAAASLAHTGALSDRDIILALLAGNIISTPMRAFRHQLPSYSGFYKPATALRLVAVNQTLRAVSLVAAGAIYYGLSG